MEYHFRCRLHLFGLHFRNWLSHLFIYSESTPTPSQNKIDWLHDDVCLFSEELRSQFFVVHNKVGPINNRHQASGFINRCKLSLPYPIGSKLTYARKKARLTNVICCLKTRETSIAIRHGTKRNAISAEESHKTGCNIQGVVFLNLLPLPAKQVQCISSLFQRKHRYL